MTLNFQSFLKTKSFQYYFDLVSVLVAKELKVRYKNSILGYFWSLLNPLALAIIFYFAFKVVMRVPIENYSFFLICGLFPWQWFANSVGSSPMVLLGNASLIKKVNFPSYFIPLASILNDAVHFLLTIPVIILFGFLFKVAPSLVYVWGIPCWFVAQFFLTYGLSLLFSSINLFFRDLERLVSLFLLLLFYLTPVFYDVSLVPKEYHGIIFLNPATGIIIGWRDLFMKGAFDLGLYFVCLFYSLGIFFVGFFIFTKLSPRFAEVL
jgi:lipopolysaccharide transport system permease protein